MINLGIYCQTSDISHTKSQNLNGSPLVFQLSLSKSDDIVGAAPISNAPTTSEWSTILLPTKMWLILKVWRWIDSCQFSLHNRVLNTMHPKYFFFSNNIIRLVYLSVCWCVLLCYLSTMYTTVSISKCNIHPINLPCWRMFLFLSVRYFSP